MDYFPTFDKKGYIDDNFDSDELNLDLIYEYLADRYQDSITYKVLEKEVTPIGCSRLVEINYDERVLEVGGLEVDEVNYMIHPDYEPCHVAEDNIDHIDRKFKLLPVAEPIIPQNKIYSYEYSRTLESELIRVGFKVLDPSPGQLRALNSESFEYSTNMKVGQYYFDRYSFVSGSEKDIKSGAIIVALQFNPFHLNAVKYIVEMDVSNWENFGYVVGKYRIKGREHLFKFDLSDIRYRIHSDNWMRNLKLDSESKYFYSKFDMVSTRPFDGWMQKFSEGVVLDTNVIGSLISNRVPLRGYSIMGPWKGDIRPGNSDKFYGPAITPRISQTLGSKVRFKVQTYDFLKNKVRLRDGRELEINKGKVVNQNFYIRYNPKNEGITVNGKFQMKKMVNGQRVKKEIVSGLLYEKCLDGEESYYEVGFRVKNMPQNKYGSLIPNLRIVSLLLVAEEIKKPEIERKMDIFLWARGEGMRKIELEDAPEVVWEDTTWSKYVNPPRIVKVNEDESIELDDKFTDNPLIIKQRVIRGDRDEKSENEIISDLISFRKVTDEEYKYPKQYEVDRGNAKIEIGDD